MGKPRRLESGERKEEWRRVQTVERDEERGKRRRQKGETFAFQRVFQERNLFFLKTRGSTCYHLLQRGEMSAEKRGAAR